MTRVMPKPFSLEVTDNLDLNRSVSGSSTFSTVHDSEVFKPATV